MLEAYRGNQKSLGISGILTQESHWSYRPKDPSEQGTQIDLIIDRTDDCINLCEIKFCQSEFVIDKSCAAELQNKIDTFRRRSKTTFLTFITPSGLHKNAYFQELVHREVTLEDFFDPVTLSL